MKTTFLRITVVLVLILSMLGFAGCPNPAKSPEKPKKEAGGKEPLPKPVKKIDKAIEELIKESGKKLKLKEEMAKGGQQSKGQGKESQAGGQGGGGGGESGGGGQGQQGGGQGGQEQGKKQEKKKESPQDKLKDWKKEEKALLDLHGQWNSFEPDAVKAGVPAERMIAFENNLSYATSAVEGKDPAATFDAANKMLKELSYIKEYFKQEDPPVTDRLMYYTQDAMLAAGEGKWDKAATDIAGLEEEWATTRMVMADLDSKPLNQTEFAIKDLASAVEKKDKALVEIKGDIVLKDIKTLEKEFKKKEKEAAMKK